MHDPAMDARPASSATGTPARQSRRTKSPVVEMVKAVLGGVAGLAIGHFVLVYAFGVNVLENVLPSSPATPHAALHPGSRDPAAHESSTPDETEGLSSANPSSPRKAGASSIVGTPPPTSQPHKTTAEIAATVPAEGIAAGKAQAESDMGVAASQPAEVVDAADSSSSNVPDKSSDAAKPAVKLPIPSVDAQMPVIERVREIYRKEYAAADTPELQAKLALQLRDDASTIQDDAVARFVMLREAFDLALSAGNGDLAEAVLRDTDTLYQVDFAGLTVHLLTSVAKSADKEDAGRKIAMKCLTFAPSLVEARKYDEALALIGTADVLATRIRDADLRRQATQLNVETQRAQQAWNAVQAAQAALRETPDDAEANLVVGRYLCGEDQNWDQGLPLLAKGSDAALAAAAKLDLAGAESPAQRLVIADAWYAAGTAEGGSGFLPRAKYWYGEAAGELTGLDKVKADKRLQALAKIVTESPLRRSAPIAAADAAQLQASAASRLNVPKVTANSIGMEFALIPSGEFMMGSPLSEKDRRDDEELHRVQITKPFYLGTTEVTQAQYELVMGTNPSEFSPRGSYANRLRGADATRFPVDKLSWHDARRFCTRLSNLPDEKKHQRTYRLPTEAEWEYACRAGSRTAFSFGEDPKLLDRHAWYGDNSGKVPFDATAAFLSLEFDDYWKRIESNQGRPHEVGTKLPNPWGLYDMHGNVWEFCEDAYVKFDPSARYVDPVAQSGSNDCVCRGGSWFFPIYQCRSAYRREQPPDKRFDDCGFRVVCIIGK